MKNERIIECVPNFSEGRNKTVIDAIAATIVGVDNVKLLNIDSGYNANRTVFTFAGNPEAVAESAFNAVRKASKLINMTFHKGEHPRIGACDVLPFVPLNNVSMEETVEISHRISERIGQELEIPVFCYENSAFSKRRRNLSNCRSGEYEGLNKKLKDPLWKPDFGPVKFNSRSGATIVGARNILVAYNINLDSHSAEIANLIATEIRESGRTVRATGGEKINYPGKLKNVKAIGWYIDEYKKAQVSMNLTNVDETPIYLVFNEVSRLATKFGVSVTGSELIGLISKGALSTTGRLFSGDPHMPEDDAIDLAIGKLGLNDVRQFDKYSRILEYLLKDHS